MGRLSQRNTSYFGNFFVDGSSTDERAGAGIVLISPEDHKIHCALKFGFKASNNKAEYETLIAGLRLEKKM